MVRSISLAAYLATARRRGGAGPDTQRPPRPDGECIWGHASTVEHAHALIQLFKRLVQLRPDLTLLLTTPSALEETMLTADGMIRDTLPEESIAAVEAFLAHWHPDLCLWTGGSLRPALLTCADRQDVPLFLVDATEEDLSRLSRKWWPDMSRSVLRRFSVILARNDATEHALHRLGVRDTEVAVTGGFQEGAHPLGCNDDERQDLGQELGSRPVWLAAMAQPEEFEIILAAHRKASRVFHRLLLILVPDDPDDGDVFASWLARDGYVTARWSEGARPEDATQVLLADTRGDLGLWYRLATISLMCSSLVPGQGGRDPNEPAAHGSAILYGPNVGRHLASYKRYAGAGAARIVRDADTLSAALEHLIAPDQSAAMAHAAWDVATVGAEVTDRILDLVQDTLDVLGQR
ncbi:3-deoxy-D-manno-octulosonic acid transferase [Roseovarius sp. E0-M6]|uniref:3-deoxy-D-manno-octulosonic acid transferase n=1 Tax=Roseovarius sp. E0-M6 TaxID=3127118 RepID=UPI003010551E